MDDPANNPTPVEAYSCALSLSLESPVTDNNKHTKKMKLMCDYYIIYSEILTSTNIFETK